MLLSSRADRTGTGTEVLVDSELWLVSFRSKLNES